MFRLLTLTAVCLLLSSCSIDNNNSEILEMEASQEELIHKDEQIEELNDRIRNCAINYDSKIEDLNNTISELKTLIDSRDEELTIKDEEIEELIKELVNLKMVDNIDYYVKYERLKDDIEYYLVNAQSFLSRDYAASHVDYVVNEDLIDVNGFTLYMSEDDIINELGHPTEEYFTIFSDEGFKKSLSYEDIVFSFDPLVLNHIKYDLTTLNKVIINGTEMERDAKIVMDYLDTYYERHYNLIDISEYDRPFEYYYNPDGYEIITLSYDTETYLSGLHTFDHLHEGALIDEITISWSNIADIGN